MFPYAGHKEYVTVSICQLRAIKYRIQAFMAKLDYFRTRFYTILAKNYFNKRTKLEAVRALTYSPTQNCWDTFVSPFNNVPSKLVYKIW